MQTIVLSVDSGGERLDRFVSDMLPELSRAAVQRLVEQGNVLVDGRERKPSYRVQLGERIQVTQPPPEPSAARPESIPLDIIYEDDAMIAVNKAAGMVVHPAAGHSSGTLVNAILAHVPNLRVGGVERPGIVHRLDADTSGLILVAKNDEALRYLQSQWKTHAVKKTYLALVQGKIQPPSGKVQASIGRDPKHRQRMAVVTRGRAREAVTVYHTLAGTAEYTLLQVEPLTGRTHQIRVHLSYMGFPVVGDTVYGRKKNRLGLHRHFLHAWKLKLALPAGTTKEFTAPLPQDLAQVLDELGLSQPDAEP